MTIKNRYYIIWPNIPSFSTTHFLKKNVLLSIGTIIILFSPILVSDIFLFHNFLKSTHTKFNLFVMNMQMFFNNEKVIYVGADGNCFYYVIAHQLGMKSEEFMTIRLKIAKYLETKKDKYLPFFENNKILTNYISSIKKKGNWCDNEIEIQAVCDVYVQIINDQGHINKFLSSSSLPIKTIKIYHQVNSHFKSIIT